MRTLVTGAGGFVGKALVPHLMGEGHDVIAATRDPNHLSSGNTIRIETVGPTTDWTDALKGVEAVVHLAARAHVLKEEAHDPLAEHRRVNTEGTRRLAEQSVLAGVKRFIFLSSIGVLGNNSLGSRNGQEFTDDDEPCPHDYYSQSKWEAEQALAKIDGIEKAIIRPCLIYGPAVPGNFRRLIDLARKGRPVPFGGIKNRRSLLGVRNLCSLISTCLTHDAAKGNTFLAADEESASTADIYRTICRHLGKKPNLINVPEPVLRAMLAAMGKSKMAQRLCDTLVVDASRVRKLLGWTQPVSQGAGLEETVKWIRSEA